MGKYPKILCANARSVVKKVDEVRTILLMEKIDIFACTESWLNSEKHDNSIVCIDGFQCVHDHRPYRVGGGVAI